MYMIIYWINDDKVYPVLNGDKTLKLFDKITEADEWAESLGESKSDARVISIEGVNE